MPRPRFFHSVKPRVRPPILWKLPNEKTLDLKLIPHGHLQALVDERGGENEYLTVVTRVLVGSLLAGLTTHEELFETDFQAAIDILILVGTRVEEGEAYRVLAEEARVLYRALHLTDDLHTPSYRRELLEMFKKTQSLVGGLTFTLKNLRNIQETYQTLQSSE